MKVLEQLTDVMYDVFLQEFGEYEPQQFTIPLNPVPASRPRVAKRGGVFYGSNYDHYLTHAVGPCNSFTGKKTPGELPIACFIEHVVDPIKCKGKHFPNGDIDNYDKGPLDAMVKSGQFFKDDVQVVFLTSVKRFIKTGEEPACHITWFSFQP